jgi:hypothetical protein
VHDSRDARQRKALLERIGFRMASSLTEKSDELPSGFEGALMCCAKMRLATCQGAAVEWLCCERIGLRDPQVRELVNSRPHIGV